MPRRLHVIVGSTRPGRVGLPVARWVHEAAARHGAFEPELVDLGEIALPIYDEPHHPRLRRYEKDHTKAWSALVARADAFAFVTPEYNYGPPPPLINALSFLVTEWAYAPAGVVSYGGVSGGLRSAQMLKTTLAGLRMATFPEGVPIPMVAQLVKDGVFQPNELIEASVKTMLDELARWTDALKDLRSAALAR
jgi:NAD(P)H-dependent FMN reductase